MNQSIALLHLLLVLDYTIFCKIELSCPQEPSLKTPGLAELFIQRYSAFVPGRVSVGLNMLEV